MKPEAPRLKLVPQSADASLVRQVFTELHDLAVPPSEEAVEIPRRGSRRWHPSMGSPLASVR